MPFSPLITLRGRIILLVTVAVGLAAYGSFVLSSLFPWLPERLVARFSYTLLFSTVACLVARIWIGREIRRLRQVTQIFEEVAGRAGATAHKVAVSSRSLSESTTSQASFLTETAASAEEMSAMVGRNSESAKNTAQSSAKSQEEAQRGKIVVDEMISAMSQINASNQAILDQVNSSNAQFAEIVTVIQEIGTKTKVINDIVFQTKLLSFNASVEAARAGEHGKGFAVVAEEVGNLAQMSGNAAKEISDMLQASTDKVSGIVESTREKVGRLIAEGKAKVNTGTEVARQCGVTLESIVRNISGVSQMASDISTASQEQATGVAEINRAMSHLDEVAQKNTVAAGEFTRVSEDLFSLSRSLTEAVSSLQAAVGGEFRPANASAAPVSLARVSNASKVRPSAKVIPLKPKSGTKMQAPETSKTGTIGGREMLPQANDPRFLDV